MVLGMPSRLSLRLRPRSALSSFLSGTWSPMGGAREFELSVVPSLRQRLRARLSSPETARKTLPLSIRCPN